MCCLNIRTSSCRTDRNRPWPAMPAAGNVSTLTAAMRISGVGWHPGEAPVYLRCPGFVAKTDAAAQEAYGPTLMRHFQNQSRLLADSSRRQNSPPDHPRWKTSRRLTEITLEETMRGSVFIGSPD